LPCQETGASLLSSYDPATGATTELLGLPRGLDPDGEVWAVGLTSWILGR